MNNILVNTPCGMMRGIDFDTHVEFRGIRYATSKRFEYPNQVTGWDNVYDATEYGNCSYQRRSFEEDAVANAFYHKEFREVLSFTYSEDCLFLNIYAPKNAKDCPVIIYIHGGSFTGGSCNEAHLNATEYAKNGVITIIFNYRLGPFGFCSHPDLSNENGVCGNYGLFDQYTAIKWVKDNIQSFGGDSENITLMGQSAGAMSVDIMTSTSLTKNYFSGAIMMSGAALQRLFMRPITPEKSIPFWDVVIKNANVKNAKELKNVEPKVLYYAWYDACKQVKSSMKYTLPVYDGKLLKKTEFNMKNITDIPYILGVTTADMIPTALKIAVKKWMKSANKSNKNKCFAYLFARDLPGDNCGAWHASDLLYAFATLKNNWRPFEKVDYKIANEMVNAICTFAKEHNPNCQAIPQWNSEFKLPMVFCEDTKTGKWQSMKLFKNTLFNRGPV